MKTFYSKAWDKFKTSEDYFRVYKRLLQLGLKQPYLDNLLRLAFDAGWKAKQNT